MKDSVFICHWSCFTKKNTTLFELKGSRGIVDLITYAVQVSWVDLSLANNEMCFGSEYPVLSVYLKNKSYELEKYNWHKNLN